MRTPLAALLLSALAAAQASPALARAADVEVRIGPQLQAEAVRSLGVRDVEDLAADLKREVVRALDRTGVLDGARIELVLVDAKPNRPTFQQLANKPGLSMESYGLGGATIEGRAIAMDGAVIPLKFRWYETDIRNAPYQATWSDADTAFSLFASRLARGDARAER